MCEVGTSKIGRNASCSFDLAPALARILLERRPNGTRSRFHVSAPNTAIGDSGNLFHLSAPVFPRRDGFIGLVPLRKAGISPARRPLLLASLATMHSPNELGRPFYCATAKAKSLFLKSANYLYIGKVTKISTKTDNMWYFDSSSKRMYGGSAGQGSRSRACRRLFQDEFQSKASMSMWSRKKYFSAADSPLDSI